MSAAINVKIRVTAKERAALVAAAEAHGLAAATFARELLDGEERPCVSIPDPELGAVRDCAVCLRLDGITLRRLRTEADEARLSLRGHIRARVFGDSHGLSRCHNGPGRRAPGGAHIFTGRLEPALWSGFVREAARVGLTKADYFRALVRGALDRPVQVKSVPPVNDDTALELNRIGNNLNQLVRLLHTRSEEDPGIDELVGVVGETIVQLGQVQADVRGE